MISIQAVGSSICHVAGQNIIQEEPPLARGRSTYVGPTIHTEQTGQVFAEPVLHIQVSSPWQSTQVRITIYPKLINRPATLSTAAVNSP